MTLKPWLQMIFGPHGDSIVQKMQEWAQNKFDALFDQPTSVAFLGPDAGEFQGTLHQGQRQGKSLVVWPETQHGGKKVLQGYFHDGLLVGNFQIQHLDSAGNLKKRELLFGKKGILHGYQLMICHADQTSYFGLVLNGKPLGCAWKAWPGGSYFFRPDVNEVQGFFIYPDLETALVGSFEGPDDPKMIEAFEAQVQDVFINTYGLMEPRFQILDPEKNFSREALESSTICHQPLLTDPYEVKCVAVRSSLIPEAGEGLFALRPLPRGRLVAFFHGIPLEEGHSGSDYSISFQQEFMIDIPAACRSLAHYQATLAHKICHSFEPNAVYAYTFHPRFGHIRCAIALQNIPSGEEITCNYKYKWDKAPPWYTKALKVFLQRHLHLDQDSIDDLLQLI